MKRLRQSGGVLLKATGAWLFAHFALTALLRPGANALEDASAVRAEMARARKRMKE